MGAAGTLIMSRSAMPARLRSWTGIALALAVLVVTSFVARTPAYQAGATGPLKGQWAVDVETPAGHLPLSIALRSSAQGGVLVIPGGLVEVEYRQEGNAFSIAAELPGSVSPTGAGATMILRGVQITAGAATGTAIFIGDAPVTDGASTFEQTTGSFSATRQ